MFLLVVVEEVEGVVSKQAAALVGR